MGLPRRRLPQPRRPAGRVWRPLPPVATPHPGPAGQHSRSAQARHPPASRMRLQHAAGGDHDRAAQALGRPVERTSPPSWRSTVVATTREPKPKRCGAPGTGGPPDSTQRKPQPGGAARLPRGQVPSDAQQAARHRQRAVLGRNWSPAHAPPWRRAAPPPAPGAAAGRPAGSARAAAGPAAAARGVGGEFLPQQLDQVGAVPAAAGQQLVRPGQRRDPSLHRPGEGARAVRPGQPQDGLHHREDILGAVVDLPRQQDLPLRRFAFLGHVADHDDHPSGRASRAPGSADGGPVARCRRRGATRYSVSKAISGGWRSGRAAWPGRRDGPR